MMTPDLGTWKIREDIFWNMGYEVEISREFSALGNVVTVKTG